MKTKDILESVKKEKKSSGSGIVEVWMPKIAKDDLMLIKEDLKDKTGMRVSNGEAVMYLCRMYKKTSY